MAGILVIDGEKSRNGSLETILRFLGYEYESGEEGDCLALLDTLSSLFAVILGSFSGKPVSSLRSTRTRPLSSSRTRAIPECRSRFRTSSAI